jgi:hypothetical protein
MENESVIKMKCIEYVKTTSTCEFIMQRFSGSTAVTLSVLLTNVCGTI